MHKCVLCSNTTNNTRFNRPDVIFHSIPKNEYRKRRWLKVLGIDHCSGWHRVCSDHFLKRDYKPGERRTLWPYSIPQPVDQNYKENRLSYNYTTQNNDVQSGNNTFLPMSEQMTNEEIDRNIVIVNTNESPRRSSRKIKLTTTNEDMSYENMPRLQTERFERTIPKCSADDYTKVIETVETPMLTTTKDHSLGHGVRCSVKNCSNRHSKDLSFFGYPKNYTLRKEWIEKCGLVNVDPAKNVKASLKVCRIHFDEDCFLNLEKKNRLRTNAVPSLFLGNDTIDERNIPSTSSLDNSGFIPVNEDEPSCSSSNYYANIDSGQTPVNIAISSILRKPKEFKVFDCSVPGCITNINRFPPAYFFPPPMTSIIDVWSSLLGVQLTESSCVCTRHFKREDLFFPKAGVDREGRSVLSLVPGALPIANNSVPLATNAVPVLKTHEGKFKRPSANKADEHILSIKKIRNYVIDKSKATTEIPYISGNGNEYTFSTNDTHQYILNRDLNPTLKTNTAKIKNPPINTDNCSTSNTSKSCFKTILPKILTNNSLSLTLQPNDKITSQTSTIKSKIMVSKNVKTGFDLSIVKTEPNDDMSDSLETNYEQTLPTQHGTYNLQPTFMPNEQDRIFASEQSIQLRNANSSTYIYTSTERQSVKTEPIENDDDLLSVTGVDDSSFSSMSITLISKPIHNSSPSIILTREFPSTSSSSVNNIPQKKAMQHERGAASTIPNIVICPELSISPINKPSSTNPSEPIKIYDSHIGGFEEKDDGFIFEIAKSVLVPNGLWQIKHNKDQNFTVFFQRDGEEEFAKKVHFYNSFEPIIHVYGKEYKHNKPIKTKIELEKLLEKIDNIEKCSGIDGHAHENCIGYLENPSEYIEVCSVCQGLIKYQDMNKVNTKMKYKKKTVAILRRQIAEKKARVSETRKRMGHNQKNENHKRTLCSKLNLNPSGIKNVMKPFH